MAAFAPGMALADAFRCEPQAPAQTMTANRFSGVNRTGGMKPAAAKRARQRVQDRRQHALVNPQRAYRDTLSNVHSVFNNSARRNAVTKSPSTAAKSFSTIDCRATSTMSIGRAIRCWFNRNASRNKRRARVRTTAPPIFLLVITPTRVFSASTQFRTRHPTASRRPCTRARSKSRPFCKRRSRGSRKGRPAALMIRCRPESGVCGQHAGGSSKSRARSWLSSGCGTRAGVCDESSMVDTGVS